jgi:hypothetical protein
MRAEFAAGVRSGNRCTRDRYVNGYAVGMRLTVISFLLGPTKWHGGQTVRDIAASRAANCTHETVRAQGAGK